MLKVCPLNTLELCSKAVLQCSHKLEKVEVVKLKHRLLSLDIQNYFKSKKT